MQKYIHEMSEFPELFEKLSFESEKFGATYTAIMFEIINHEKYVDFWNFLLKELRISDTIFSYSETKILVILEETTLRWALLLNNELREEIEDRWYKFKFFCSATQWNFIDNNMSLEKTLEKKLSKAKKLKTKECVYSLSSVS